MDLEHIELENIVKKINEEYLVYKNTLEYTTDANVFFGNETKKLIETLGRLINDNCTEETALKIILPKAYGLVKLATEYLLNKPHYDVQLMGGILLNDGCIAEMATGEGKTITAALPAYLNALLGHGVHIVTPNSYLAKRDYEELKQVYEILGLSCGLIEDIDYSNNQKEILAEFNGIVKKKKLDSKRLTKEEIKDIQKEATEIVRIKDIKKRQEIYKCDIVYGSSSALAFDNLFDDLEPNPDLIRRRIGKPNFVLVDEADVVLIDDAVTPFTLSGNQTDESLAISEEEKQKRKDIISLAARALEQIEKEDKRLNQYFALYSSTMLENGYTENLSTDGLIYETKDEKEFEEIKTGTDEKYDSTQALYICRGKKDFYITTVGYVCFFLAFKEKEITELINNNKALVTSFTYNGEPLLKKGLDYDEKDGVLTIYPRALSYIIETQVVPELSEAFDNFMTGEFVEYYEDIKNAIVAWKLLERDVDYMFTIPSDTTNVDRERCISLIMNGRIADGRVYSNGLQQAVEAKEKIKIEQEGGIISIRDSKINDTLISIPTASFFSRYKKFSGMTGTSSKETIDELYGLETKVVPRNKQNQVTDRGEKLFLTELEKNNEILKEVIKSHEKGQPVLITTTSVKESERLKLFLETRLKEYYKDHPEMIVDIPVLNASVDKLSEEAKIIAQAGKKGAITISTEMAGRGTDIRLGGGEVPSLEDEIKKERTNTIIKLYGSLINPNELTYHLLMGDINKDKKLIEAIEKNAKMNYDKNVAAREKEEKEVLQAGGLKVIGSGHFLYKRTDDQVKGRCGRQGNVGEFIFLNDIDDLERIGCSIEKVERYRELLERLEGKPLIEDNTDRRRPLKTTIERAQKRNETDTKNSIYYNQRVEVVVANCRSNLRDNIEDTKRNNNYVQRLGYMIEEVAYDMIISTSNLLYFENIKLANEKIASIGLKHDQLISLVDEFFGAELTEQEIDECRTFVELSKILQAKATKKIRDLDLKEEDLKPVVDRNLNRAWFSFEEKLSNIKFQQAMSLSSNVNPLEDLSPSILDAYTYCLYSAYAQTIREVLNKDYKDKYPEDHFGLTEFVINPDDLSTQRKTHKKPLMRKEVLIEENPNQVRQVAGLEIFPAFRVVADHRLSLKEGGNPNIVVDSRRKK